MNHLTVRKLLQETLMNELKSKSIDSILVNEITEKANVARSSFYRYYHTLRDVVLDYVLTKIGDEVVIDEELDYRSILANARSLFTLIYKYKDEFEILVRDNLYDVVFKAIHSMANAHALNMGIKDQTYLLASYSGAISGLIIEWFSNGLIGSIDDMVKIFVEVTAIKENM